MYVCTYVIIKPFLLINFMVFVIGAVDFPQVLVAYGLSEGYSLNYLRRYLVSRCHSASV